MSILFKSSPAQLKVFDEDEFWLDVFSLDVDKRWLTEKLQQLSRDDCLNEYKVCRLHHTFSHTI